jgi:hypothetical protein
MRLAKRSFVMAAIMLSFCSNQNQAYADYFIAPPIEQYKVALDDWLLVKTKEQWTLQCSYKGSHHAWKVNKFLLADRLDSNSICCGKYKELTESYLQALSKMKVGLAVELVSDKKNGALGVAGLWSLDEVPHYKEFFCRTNVTDKPTRERILKGTPQAFAAIGAR